MNASGLATPVRRFAPELDVFRGIAAIFMIVNHAGYRLLSADDAVNSSVAPAVFLGSVAPAVFFFATGVGIGLSRSATPRAFDGMGVLWKALLLVLADQFFFWGRGAGLGLDFFSFIAIATVTLSLISQFRHPVGICFSLTVFLLISRYGLATVLSDTNRFVAPLEWFYGAHAVVNVSYPLSPWMAFALLGFACGSGYRGVSLTSALPRDDWIKRGFAVATICFALSLVFYFLNRGFFRWGTVSVAYFVFAVATVVSAALVAIGASMYSGRLAQALALRGVASFAVIPLHYALLEVATQLRPQPLSAQTFVVACTCLIAVSFFTATKFALVASQVGVARAKRLPFSMLVGLVLACGVAINMSAASSLFPSAMVTFIAQMAIACLLGMRVPRSSSQRSVQAGGSLR